MAEGGARQAARRKLKIAEPAGGARRARGGRGRGGRLPRGAPRPGRGRAPARGGVRGRGRVRAGALICGRRCSALACKMFWARRRAQCRRPFGPYLGPRRENFHHLNRKIWMVKTEISALARPHPPRAPGLEGSRYHALRTWGSRWQLAGSRDLAGARRRPARRGRGCAQLDQGHPDHQLGRRAEQEARVQGVGGARLPPRLAATRPAPNPRASHAHP